jgi:DNA-binding MarR family transcriptional regulator
MDKVRVSRAARQLRVQGYIEQRMAEDDRRQVILQLTPRGKEVCRDLTRAVRDLQTTLFGSVGSDEYEVFERVLNTFESHAKMAESSACESISQLP